MKQKFGQSMWLPPFRGRVNSNYDHPRFLEAVTNCESLLDSPDCEILHEGRNRLGVVSLPRKDGARADIVIKEFCARGANKIKSIFLPGKASKAWTGAHRLLEREIGTPFPVAYLEERGRFSLRRSYYLSERIEGAEEVRSLFRSLPPQELESLLLALARFLSNCHQKCVLHRDLSDGNILVRKSNQSHLHFFLIDTNRVRVKKHINLLSGVKNLIRLGIPPGAQRFFLSCYLGDHSVKTFIWLWYRFHKLCYSWYIEMKKKLRLRQIARRLRIQ